MMEEGFTFMKNERGNVLTSDDVNTVSSVIVKILGNPTGSSLGRLFNLNGSQE